MSNTIIYKDESCAIQGAIFDVYLEMSRFRVTSNFNLRFRRLIIMLFKMIAILSGFFKRQNGTHINII
jgi:hypothetical protein